MKKSGGKTIIVWARLISILFVLSASLFLFTGQAIAQGGDKDCEQFKKDIVTLQEALAQEATALHDLEQRFPEFARSHQKLLDHYKKFEKSFWFKAYSEEYRAEVLEKIRQGAVRHSKLVNIIEDSKLTIQALKDTIADLLNKLGDCGAKKPDDSAKPKPKPSPSPISGGTPSKADGGTKSKLDQCLVGKWVGSKLIDTRDTGYTGGTGFTVTFSADGTQTIDYSGMAPMTKGRDNYVYRGSVVVKMLASPDATPPYEYGNAEITWTSKTISNIGVTYDQKETYYADTGPGGLMEDFYDKSYKCSANQLEFTSRAASSGPVQYQVTLKRAGGSQSKP